MLKYYNSEELWNILINYIEHNKSFNNISYSESIEFLEELLKNLKEEYRSVENE